MANPEHLAKLKKGVKVWNKWRDESPGIAPDLRKAGLQDSDLAEFNLFEANMQGADLWRANLVEANLQRAILWKADLKAACLEGADLRQANVWNADLRAAGLVGANLEGTILQAANLWAADLSGANVTNAKFGQTIIGDIDLSSVIGLEDVIHHGPSSIGIDTILRSKGQIPESFLRGCGVPDNFIEYISSLMQQPIQYYSCFISYSHADKSFARRLYDSLQERGIRCWLDEHQLLPGDHILREVDKGIRLWDKVLLCCSKDSLTSWWVDKELDKAIQKEEVLSKKYGEEALALIPLDLDGYVFNEWESEKESFVKSRFIADFIGWKTDNAKFEKQFEKLVRALQIGDRGREKPPNSIFN